MNKGFKFKIICYYKTMNKNMYSTGIKFKWDGLPYSLHPYSLPST